ncbi:MAG: flagellar biosynthesis protein FlgL [Parvibaculum sp.]|uniref:flagellar biosynthesis protein FlgL n=1 Tax=Parvibaculum sp. TaxID=2024848 RepID=UPI00283EDFBE|nr:flagellar biosynthesis protein FlgL [Parvibaculum sp.]MDR3500559.1 flagellar biosynthesis protein FlgL [Parvibaculum sp.]
MQISSYSNSVTMKSAIGNIQQQLADLQRQLTTGYKANSFSQLGTSTSLVLALNNQVDQSNSYLSTINATQLRIQTSSNVMSSLNTIASSLQTGGLSGAFNLTSNAGTQTSLQETAGSYLSQITSMLNENVADRQLFGGKNTQTPPVVSPSLMLNGDTTHAGLTTLIAQRNQADLGATGTGRLTVSSPASGSVAVTEDAGIFGFKLSNVSSSLTGATVTPPSGSPASLNVAFGATLPANGDSISMDLKLPDGTTTTIKLTATSTSPAGAGQFTIGADAATTAANFQAALGTSIQTEAKTTLTAASAVQASNEFFSNPPLRVAGTPLTSATGLQNGTPNDTVIWYQGDTSQPAGNNFVSTIGSGQQVSYGARADQTAISTLVKTAALLSAVQYSSSDPNAAASYAALTQRTSTALTYTNTQSLQDIATDLGLKSANLTAATSNLKTQVSTSQSLLANNINSDDTTVATQLSALMTQLQASYQVTATLSKLSLATYLPA